jgi:hypothetical protein
MNAPAPPDRLLPALLLALTAVTVAGAYLLRYSLALPIAVSGLVSGVCAVAAYAEHP